MVLVSSISKFFSNEIYHENKWMRKKYILAVIQLYHLTYFCNFKTSCHNCTLSVFRVFSFRFLSVFLSKIMHCKFFCEIAKFTSRLLPFDNFSKMVLIIDFFMTINSIFSKKPGKSQVGLNGFK